MNEEIAELSATVIIPPYSDYLKKEGEKVEWELPGRTRLLLNTGSILFLQNTPIPVFRLGFSYSFFCSFN